MPLTDSNNLTSIERRLDRLADAVEKLEEIALAGVVAQIAHVEAIRGDFSRRLRCARRTRRAL